MILILKRIAIIVLCLIFLGFGSLLGAIADYTYNIIWSGFLGYLYKAVWITLALIPLSFIPLVINKKYFMVPIMWIALVFGLYTIIPAEGGETYKQQTKIYEASLYQAYLNAAMQGDPHGIANVVIYYYYGYGNNEQNYAEAAKWFMQLDPNNPKLKIPKSGDTYVIQKGRMLLGEMYYDGKGVNQDYALALKWLNLTIDMCEHGCADCRFASEAGLKVADYYFYVAHDYKKSKELYTKNALADKAYADKMLLEIKSKGY